MNVRINSYALGMLFASAFMIGCASQKQLVPQDAMQAAAAAPSLAVPVCGGSRVGQAQCDALVDVGPNIFGWHGYTAAEIEAAYNLPSTSSGEGQIVAVVDAYDDPRILKDLSYYRRTMGLPRPDFRKYNQRGLQRDYPEGSPAWGVEIALDTEMVSASCPNCTIYLVEADSQAWSSLETAEREAVKLGATVISNSYGGTGAFCGDYRAKGVTYLASAGDSGLGIQKPASCDDVVAVGGTVLTPAKNNRGYTETIWGESGGACSTEPKPEWQHDDKCANRFADDVSSVAVNVAVYDTYGGATGWIKASGTSLSSPFLAGVFGLAGNSKLQEGGKTFWWPGHDKYLYQLTVPRYSQQGGWGSPDGIGAF